MFSGKTTKAGYSSVSSYVKVDNKGYATHVKVKGENTFFPLPEKVKIVGTELYCRPSEMEAGQRYEYVYSNGNTVEIENVLFRQLSIMQATAIEQGNFLRCDDGVYVHKREMAPPAYAKLNVPVDHLLTSTKMGRHYATLEIVTLSDDTQIRLPNDKVTFENGKWYYTDAGVRQQVRYSSKEVRVDKFLVGDKIVDANKLRIKDGDYCVSINGADVIIGSPSVDLATPFVESASLKAIEEINIDAHNKLKQRPRLDQPQKLTFTFIDKFVEEGGITRVEVNKDRTIARFTYKDGHEVVYCNRGIKPRVRPGVDTEIKEVGKFEIQDMGEQGYRFSVMQMAKGVATDVEFVDKKLSSYNINGDSITDIKWDKVDETDYISSYKFNDVKVENIVWHAGRIKSCIVVINEGGTEQRHDIPNMALSPYKQYAITYKLTEHITKVVWGETGIKSFQMGDKKFTDIEWKEDGNIKKCNVNGKEIDFDRDKRFAQLRLSVATTLTDQKFMPLLRSKLLDKKDNKYILGADLVQTTESRNGVDECEEVLSLEQAERAIEWFKEHPYSTVYIDDNGKAHRLTDVVKTYSESSDFEYKMNQDSIIAQILGKNGIEYKKMGNGYDINVKPSKAEENSSFYLVETGAILCNTIIGLPIGVILLAAGGLSKLGFVANRKVKKAQIKNETIETVQMKVQANIKEQVQDNINKLVKTYQKEVNRVNKKSSAESAQVLKGLENDFKASYLKEVSLLQMLDEGSIKSSFTMGKKGKLTSENYLGYLQARKQSEEIVNGKRDHTELPKLLHKLDADKSLSKEDKLLKRVELLKKYGGRESQIEAYKLQKNNVDIFANIDPGLSKDEQQMKKKEYLSKIESEFNAGKNVWGGINDKKDYLCNTSQYRLASNAERKNMLKKLEDKLMSESKSVSVEEIKFSESLNDKGEREVESLSADAIAHMNLAITMFSGSSEKIPPFNFGNRERMTQLERDAYAPVSGNLADHCAPVSYTVIGRSIVNDSEKINSRAKDLGQRAETIASGSEQIAEIAGKIVERQNYVEALRGGVALTNKMTALNSNAGLIMGDLDAEMASPLGGLRQDTLTAVREKVTSSVANAEQSMLDVDAVADSLRDEYKEEVSAEVDKTFIERNQAYLDEYKRIAKLIYPEDKRTEEEYRRDFIKSIYKTKSVKELKASGKFDQLTETQKHTCENNERLRRNYAFIQTQIDVDEKIDAYTICDMKQDSFHAYCAKVGYAPDSEYARLAYYTDVKLKYGEELKSVKESEAYAESRQKGASAYFKAELQNQHKNTVAPAEGRFSAERNEREDIDDEDEYEDVDENTADTADYGMGA